MTTTGAPRVAAAMSTSRYRPAYGALVLTGSQFVALGLSFVGGAVMVRTTAPVMIASYLLLLQAIMALTLLMQLGLVPATLRFAPLARGRGGRHATAQLRSRLTGLLLGTWSLLAVPVLMVWPAVAIHLDAAELAPAGTVILAAAALLAFNQVMDAYLRSFRRYGTSAFAGDILPRAVTSLGFVTLFLFGNRVHWTTLAMFFLASQIISALALGGALITTTSAEESEPRTASPAPPASYVLSTALTMALRAGTSILMATSAVWVLSWARPHEEVAVFGVMLALLQVVGLIPNGIARVVTQEFAPLHADGRRAELEQLVRSCATVTGFVALGTFLLLAVAGQQVIRLAYGNMYVTGWPILMVLAAGTFIDAALGFSGYLLQMTGHHMKLLVVSLCAALVNIALSVVLVRPYGGVGVAIANTLSLVLLNAAMVVVAKRRIRIRTVAYLEFSQWRAIAAQGLNRARAALVRL